MIRKTTKFGFAIAAMLVATSGQLQAGIMYNPGSALGIDASLNRIFQYSSDGTTIEGTLGLRRNLLYTGIAAVGSEVFVSSGVNVFRVNQTNGAVDYVFRMRSGNESLGRKGDNLISVNFSGGRVEEYTTSGGFVGYTNLSIAGSITGLDSNGSQLFSGQYQNFSTGGVRVYDATTGQFQSTLNLGLGFRRISGLAYDDGAGNYWVSTGFGDDRIRRYNSSGVLLSNISAGAPWVNGMTVWDSTNATVPEPTSLALFGIGALGLVFRRPRRS